MESFTTKPETLLRVTCCGGGGKGPLGAFFKKMGNDPRICDEAMRYCMTYLWTANSDGKESKAKDPEKGTSRNAITYWDPKSGGIVAYLRERANYAVAQYVEVNSIPKESVSLDKLKEFNLEISNSGDFVRALENYSDDNQDEHDRALRQDFAEMDESEITENLNARSEFDPEAELDTPIEDFLEAAGILQEEREIQRQAKMATKAINFRSDNRPDLVWMEQALGLPHDPEPDFDDRMEQTKGLASEVVGKLCSKLPGDELESIKEDLQEWDPSKSNFFQIYPDVVAEVDHQIATKEKTAHIIQYMKNEKGVDGIQSTFGINQDELTANDLIAEKKLWRTRSTPEGLKSPTRPDFEYLKKAIRVDGKEGFESYTDPRRLKAMGYRYISGRTQENRLGIGLRSGMTEWNPEKKFFHEQVMETIADISINGQLSDKELQQAMVMMNPDSTVAKKARMELQIESSIDRELQAQMEKPETGEQMGLF